MSAAQLPLIIVNPASAGGATGRQWPAMALTIRNQFGPFQVQFTKRSGDATALALTAARQGQRAIIACGGDGTICEVANGIIRSEQPVELGILPHGSGGDFRRTLALPERFADAAQALANCITKQIDVGELNYQNRRGETEQDYFINVSSFGLGGEVVKRAQSSQRNFGGSIAYGLATLAASASFESPEIWLQFDDEEPVRRRIANLSIANGRYFGGGMKIAPAAKLNDGLFEVIAIKPISTAALIANSPRLYFGTHQDLDYVATRQAKRIIARPVDQNELIRLERDGEVSGFLPATFQIKANALMVRVPKKNR